MPDRLQVWLHGEHVAGIERRTRNDRRLRLFYTDEARERWPLNSPLVSCSLPLSRRPLEANAYLAGLLPEGEALAAMAARAGTSVIDTFGLLRRYGRDVAGALVIGEGPPDARAFGLERYDEESLAAEVGSLDKNPLGIHDDSELSLAGLQNKLLLVRAGDQWARPLYGRPSTHILKVEDRRLPGLAQAEADCLALARAAGLTSIEHDVVSIAGIPCLVVSRYDRKVSARGQVTRIHQEDLCQATGTDGAANRGRAKYQRRGGGGPGYAEVATLLNAYTDDPAGELAKLASTLAFTIVIGNADAHAKNLSFLHDERGNVELAPLYDTVPTVLWSKLTVGAAMSVNGRFRLPAITLADVVAEATGWPLDADAAEEAARVTIEAVADATETIATPELATHVRARAHQLLDD